MVQHLAQLTDGGSTMIKTVFHYLAAMIFSAAILLAGCDSSILDEKGTETEFVIDAPSELLGDEETTSNMSGETIEALLEDNASKYGIFGGVVSIMTRNMYVGTDVDAIMAAEPQDVPAAVAQAWALLQQTDFAGRMKALAREISRARPHLVGLQEVTTFRAQTPGDAAFGGTTPAEDVQIDFLVTLLDELQKRGHSYRVVARVQNIDVELPLITNPDPAAFESTDIRMTDYDVILARHDVKTSSVVEQTYAAYFTVFGGSVDIKRGFVAVDATIRNKSYRFISTHLEPVETAGGYFQTLQAQELLGILANESKPLILVGDLNTDALTGDVYNMLVSSGYQDVWNLKAGRRNDGFTCCQAKDLANKVSELDRRIDFIFVKDFPHSFPRLKRTLAFSRVTDAFPWEQTSSGLWASDHAGVAAWIFIPRH